ncbi:hypothetical protein B0H11DRAFT_1960654 [Mycena galericulata]|nr:hypothetical protein B0H11DRAFT_1960654 [Mycena galericulata]
MDFQLHPDNKRQILDADYLACLDIDFLKSIIKAHQSVKRMNPGWQIKSDVSKAVGFLVEQKVSVNWLFVKMQMEDVGEDYLLDTLQNERDIDKLFRAAVAGGNLAPPTSTDAIHPEAPTAEPLGPTVVLQSTVSSPAISTGTILPPSVLQPTDLPPLDDFIGKPMHEVVVIIRDERHGSGQSVVPRAATIHLYELRKEGERHFIKSPELIQELQKSSEAIVGFARLSVDFKIAGMTVRRSFHILREGVNFAAPPEIPELCVTVEDGNSKLYSLEIFLDAGSFGGKDNGAQSKRHFSTLSGSDGEEEKHRRGSTPSSAHATSGTATAAERDSAQIRWLAGTSGYDNAIAKAIRSQVKTKQSMATCALGLFCSYVRILANITPGAGCDSAGRVAITHKVIAVFLETGADWVGFARSGGNILVNSSHIPVIAAHLNGDVADSYMGMKAWKNFLDAAVANSVIKEEAKE